MFFGNRETPTASPTLSPEEQSVLPIALKVEDYCQRSMMQGLLVSPDPKQSGDFYCSNTHCSVHRVDFAQSGGVF